MKIEKKKKARIYVVTHKEYQFPENKLYRPIIAGAAEYEPNQFPREYIRDNIGESISDKHDAYSEYTTVYWAWKNSRADIIGINHYRRYFISGGWGSYLCSLWNPQKALKRKVLNQKDLARIFDQGYNCILPKKRWRVSRTVREEFELNHSPELLDQSQAVIEECYPEYLNSFLSLMQAKENYQKCICIMTRELFNSYAEWIFSVMENLEKKGVCGDDRGFAFLAERLMNVWIEKEKQDGRIKLKELFFINSEVSRNSIMKDYTEIVFPKIMKPFLCLADKLHLWNSKG